MKVYICVIINQNKKIMSNLKSYHFAPKRVTSWEIELNNFYRKDVPFIFKRRYIYKNYFKPFYKNFFNN